MPRYTSVWLDCFKAKNIKFDAKDVLIHLVMGNPDCGDPSLCIFMCIHIFAYDFVAAVMHVPGLGTSQLPLSPTSLT